MPSFMAIASAVLKPMPRISRASRYGFSVMTWMASDITMPARPRSQNAKTILGVVVGYSLDEARQHLLGRRFRLWTHVDYPGPVGPIENAEDVLRWNFGAGECRIFVRTPLPRANPLAIAGAARIRHGHHQSPCLSVHVYWTVVGHQLTIL